jgi:sulfur-oxidizing protein SoxY
MAENARGDGLTRRLLLAAACVGGAELGVGGAWARDDATDLLEQLTGRAPTASDRVRLTMPPVFPNGYTVPLALEVDSPMTESDHVVGVRVFAPRNPLVEVATFRFTPASGLARASTRIRLAQPQHVVAVAELSDGTLLMAKAWVEVATNGCA